MILLLDNYDSFTYNLVDYFSQLGARCEVKRNDVPLEELLNEDFKALVISPGPEIPLRAGHLMQVLDHYAGRKPVLGICLGHQAIGEYYGATLVRARRPMHGKVSRIRVDNKDILFSGLPPEVSVVRYNSLVIQNPMNELQVTAVDEFEEIMAISHITAMVHGVQFHPEAILTESGKQMLQNWLECYRLTV